MQTKNNKLESEFLQLNVLQNSDNELPDILISGFLVCTQGCVFWLLSAEGLYISEG